MKKKGYLTATVVLTAALAVGVPVGAAKADATGPAVCYDTGNGLLCISLDPLGTQPAQVTVWYDKRSGDPVFVNDLGYTQIGNPGSGNYEDGAFWISAGQLRGYDWDLFSQGSGCFAPTMFLRHRHHHHRLRRLRVSLDGGRSRDVDAGLDDLVVRRGVAAVGTRAEGIADVEGLLRRPAGTARDRPR